MATIPTEVHDIRIYCYRPGDRIIVRLGVTRVSEQEAYEAIMKVRAFLDLGPEVPMFALGRYDDITVLRKAYDEGEASPDTAEEAGTQPVGPEGSTEEQP